MRLLRLNGILVAAVLCLTPGFVRSAPQEPEKDTTAKDESFRPFFNIDAAIPTDSQLAFRGLHGGTLGGFGFQGLRSSLDSPSMALSSDSPSQGFGQPQSAYIPPTPFQVWQQQQYNQYVYNQWQAWKTSRQSSGPSIWLPGMGSSSQGETCGPIAHFAMLNANMVGLPVKPGRPSFIPSNCFTAATPVHLAGSAEGQAIERIAVGQRVLGNAAETKAIAPLAWRRVELRATRQDGTVTDIVLLRPAEWLDEQGAQVGSMVPLHIPECGYTGLAQVKAIEPCPAIASGTGAVVTGTFRHTSATIVRLVIEGQRETIGTTANHRIWSEDRQDFVRADALVPGELLRGVAGTCKFVRLESQTNREPVFNLEVHGGGAFHVGKAGLLARDAGTGPAR